MHDLPDFGGLCVTAIVEALEEKLNINRRQITALAKIENPDWTTLIHPLERMDNDLAALWSPLRHLHAVVNNEELQQAYKRVIGLLSEYQTELGQHTELHQAYQKIRHGEHYPQLNAPQKKVIDHALLTFTLSGVDLPTEKKRRYKEIQQQLTQSATHFEQNIQDVTESWVLHYTDSHPLRGLPPSVLAAVQHKAEQRGLSGYAVTLDFPAYHAVMTYAEDRQLREQLYRAYTTRASELGGRAENDNSELLQQILVLRTEAAQLLGFDNYAQQSCVRKMAQSPQEVEQFLYRLVHRVRAQAELEMDALKQFAAQELNLKQLQYWDLDYVGEKYRQQHYQLSTEELKAYFPVEQVITGLFNITEKLFNVRFIRRMDVSVWHEDVHFYDLFDANQQCIAGFYLDLYARRDKRGGAWMDEYLPRLKMGTKWQRPVAFLSCNATPPLPQRAALFTHEEVITLFHEFGHGLHHMLTRIDYADVAGMNGVEWDAVELPSQFMENWCWQWQGIEHIARHYVRAEKMPKELYTKMLRGRHFQAGIKMLRQLEYALFDIKIHQQISPPSAESIAQILQAVREETEVMQVPLFNRFQHGFSHIFAGGYAAGYYGYLWAEMLSADAFARFEEEGLFNPQVGEDFLQQILARGSSRSAMDNFIAFRGRKPELGALLRHAGITLATETSDTNQYGVK